MYLLVCGALSGYGVYSSVRLTRSDSCFHRNTVESVADAVRLDPSRGLYRLWLAELLENDGRDGSVELAAATRLNPMDSRIWIRRALSVEAAGDRAEAERLLLHAASIDRLMEPRWTLMNFYFRAGDEAKFWPWARQALEISYGDRGPLFDLCWRVRESASVIESAALPAKYPVRAQFVRFLLERGRAAEAGDMAALLVPEAPLSDAGLYEACVEGLLQVPGDGALKLWNVLCRRRLVPFEPLDPPAGRVLTNGGFEREPSSTGFDWRVPKVEGVSAFRTVEPVGMRFALNHKQPDSCQLLTQTVPLLPKRSYRLTFIYRTTGIPPGSGLRVRAGDRTGPDLSSESWTGQSITFHSGAPGRESIAFEYQRPQGVVRIEGTLDIRSVSVEAVQ